MVQIWNGLILPVIQKLEIGMTGKQTWSFSNHLAPALEMAGVYGGNASRHKTESESGLNASGNHELCIN